MWEVATERGDRYVLKKVSTFGAPDPVRRFTSEARILTYLLQRGVPVAVPVLADGGKAYTTDDEGSLGAVFPMHEALTRCPFGIESWEVGPGTR